MELLFFGFVFGFTAVGCELSFALLIVVRILVWFTGSELWVVSEFWRVSLKLATRPIMYVRYVVQVGGMSDAKKSDRPWENSWHRPGNDDFKFVFWIKIVLNLAAKSLTLIFSYFLTLLHFRSCAEYTPLQNRLDECVGYSEWATTSVSVGGPIHTSYVFDPRPSRFQVGLVLYITVVRTVRTCDSWG